MSYSSCADYDSNAGRSAQFRGFPHRHITAGDLMDAYERKHTPPAVSKPEPEKAESPPPAGEPQPDFPEAIRVSGLPLLLMGWNGIYRRVIGGTRSSKVVYRLNSYLLFSVIYIASVDIYLNSDGFWVFSPNNHYGSSVKTHSRQLFGDFGAENIHISPPGAWLMPSFFTCALVLGAAGLAAYKFLM